MTTFDDSCFKRGVKAGEKSGFELELNTKTPAQSQIGEDCIQEEYFV
jgi:hypothetical protein